MYQDSKSDVIKKCKGEAIEWMKSEGKQKDRKEKNYRRRKQRGNNSNKHHQRAGNLLLDRL
jgi:hypothetical protein